MSSSLPIPPHPAPRKVYRSRDNRVVGGVCAGVAEYLNLDPTIVRVLTVLLTLFTGAPVVVYLVALMIVPEEPPAPDRDRRPPVTGAVDPVWGPQGAPWEQPPNGGAGFTAADPAGPATQRPTPAGDPGADPAPRTPEGATREPSAGTEAPERQPRES